MAAVSRGPSAVDRVMGFEPPVELPEHGVYHPALAYYSSTPGEPGSLESWESLRPIDRPVVGIAFYRAHRMSGNLRFVDALVAALERRGLKALPVYTSSLRALGPDGKSAALSLFSRRARIAYRRVDQHNVFRHW